MARRSKRTGAPGTERGRSPSGVPGASADQGRWSSRRKMEAVLRLLQGEDLDAVSRSLRVSTSRLSQWRDEFLAGGQSALLSREPDLRDARIKELCAKVGELTMENELLFDKVDRMEANLPPDLRRPRR